MKPLDSTNSQSASVEEDGFAPEKTRKRKHDLLEESESESSSQKKSKKKRQQLSYYSYVYLDTGEQLIGENLTKARQMKGKRIVDARRVVRQSVYEKIEKRVAAQILVLLHNDTEPFDSDQQASKHRNSRLKYTLFGASKHPANSVEISQTSSNKISRAPT